MKSKNDVLKEAGELRWQLPQDLHDRIAESIYGEAASPNAASRAAVAIAVWCGNRRWIDC